MLNPTIVRCNASVVKILITSCIYVENNLQKSVARIDVALQMFYARSLAAAYSCLDRHPNYFLEGPTQ
jgi:cell division ATPase FtsA